MTPKKFCTTHRLSMPTPNCCLIAFEVVDDSAPDGFYETVHRDFTMTYFRVKDGVRRGLTEAQLKRQLSNAEQGKNRFTGKFHETDRLSRFDRLVEKAVHDDCFANLRQSTESPVVDVTVTKSQQISASSERYRTGKVVADWAYYGTCHTIETNTAAFLRVMTQVGRSCPGDGLVILDSYERDGIPNLYVILEVMCARSARAGTELVRRFVVVFDDRESAVVKTFKGAQSLVTRGLKRRRLEEVDARIIAEQKAIEEMDRRMAEQIRIDRESWGEEDPGPIPQEDMDALGHMEL